MNADIKREWLAELRSGKIPQCRALLNDGEGRCCLGVLCDIAVKHGVIEMHLEDGRHLYGTDTEFKEGQEKLFYLPDSVIAWAGLDTYDPWVKAAGATYRTRLSNLNDSGLTFERIADIIEEQL